MHPVHKARKVRFNLCVERAAIAVPDEDDGDESESEEYNGRCEQGLEALQPMRLRSDEDDDDLGSLIVFVPPASQSHLREADLAPPSLSAWDRLIAKFQQQVEVQTLNAAHARSPETIEDNDGALTFTTKKHRNRKVNSVSALTEMQSTTVSSEQSEAGMSKAEQNPLRREASILIAHEESEDDDSPDWELVNLTDL